MKRTRCHKCRFCGELFKPNPRILSHHYCGKGACRTASKKASQKSWIHTPTGRHYHSGPEQVDRVQSWRKTHPGYGCRKERALQDLITTQPVAPQAVITGLNSTCHLDKASCAPDGGLNRPLQDLITTQDPLVVGLIAHLTGALQDEIASQIIRFQTHGQQILRKGPGIAKERSLSG
jgi:hypothetical protein